MSDPSSEPVAPDADESKSVKLQIREKDLFCVNGCGFYGTPQWGNRCSKCWRAHQISEKRNQDFARNRTLLSFDNFQERRKLSTESRSLTLRKMFRSPTMHNSASSDGISSSAPQQTTSQVVTPVRRRELSPDSRAARESLTDFLVTHLPTGVVQEVTRQTKYAVNKIYEIRIPPDDLSELVQQFYQFLSDKLNQSSFFHQEKATIKPEDVLEEVEKYICICCYSNLFCATTDEEIADLSLQDRIRSLNWVTAGFVETKLDFTRKSVRDFLDDAIAEMIDINSRRRADEKLTCLIRCSHRIFDALKESGAPTSADEFLPVLINVLLRGNPPLIQSNLKFISRYALPSRVMSGESGYFFTNLSCAMQFVQDMNHESLRMEKREFEAYVSGDLVPPLNMMNCGCNQALGSLEKSLQRVRQLIEKQHALSTRIEEMGLRISSESAEFVGEIDKTLSLYPSAEYLKMKDEIAKEEQETHDLCSLTSTRSSRESEDADEPSTQGTSTQTSVGTN